MKINLKFQNGLTLVELLVASFLGVLLTGVVGSMYVTSSKGFRSTNELSRVQENTRFALHFLQRSIREVGFSQCGANVTRDFSFLSDPNNSTVGGGLIGWEFSGTETGNAAYDLSYVDLNASSSQADITAARNSNAGNTTDWTTIAGGPALDDIVNNYFPVRGSDVIAITTEEVRDDINIQTTNGNTINLAGGSESLPQRAIVKVGNCAERNIFSKTNNINAASMAAGNGSGNVNRNARPPGGNFWSQSWGPEHRIFSDVTKFFFVGTGASGLPSLVVVESVCGFQITNCGEAPEALELVEGVENMQILYGVDTDGDNVANQFFSADQIVAPNVFNNVVTIRISLLMRSNQLSEESEFDAGRTYTLADGVQITPDDVGRGMLRFVSNATIELRNRGE